MVCFLPVDCSDKGLMLETSAKHHIPLVKNIPYQPLLIKPKGNKAKWTTTMTVTVIRNKLNEFDNCATMIMNTLDRLFSLWFPVTSWGSDLSRVAHYFIKSLLVTCLIFKFWPDKICIVSRRRLKVKVGHDITATGAVLHFFNKQWTKIMKTKSKVFYSRLINRNVSSRY